MENYLFCVVICCSFLQISRGYFIESETTKNNDLINKKVHPPTLYKDAESIIKVLEQPQYIKHDGILELIKYYYEAKIKKFEFDHLGTSKQYPLIVIEGVAGSGKTTAVMGLSKKINASAVHRISRDIKALQDNYDKLDVLHDATRQLMRYIQTLELHPLLNNTPVVLDRYWGSTAISVITHKAYYFNENVMPPKGDQVYNWPASLLKPDVIIFLQVNEKERQRRIRDRIEKLCIKEGDTEKLLRTHPEYLNDVLLGYANMNNSPAACYVVDGSKSPENVLEDIYAKVKPFLID